MPAEPSRVLPDELRAPSLELLAALLARLAFLHALRLLPRHLCVQPLLAAPQRLQLRAPHQVVVAAQRCVEFHLLRRRLVVELAQLLLLLRRPLLLAPRLVLLLRRHTLPHRRFLVLLCAAGLLTQRRLHLHMRPPRVLLLRASLPARLLVLPLPVHVAPHRPAMCQRSLHFAPSPVTPSVALGGATLRRLAHTHAHHTRSGSASGSETPAPFGASTQFCRVQAVALGQELRVLGLNRVVAPLARVTRYDLEALGHCGARP